MKHSKKSLLFLFCVFAYSINMFAWDGKGTQNDPYLISTPNDFDRLRTNNEPKYFKLVNDIDMADFGEFLPILKDETLPFNARIDGDGFVVKNLTVTPRSISHPNHKSVGIFGVYGMGATANYGSLENIGFENITIEVDMIDNPQVEYVGIIGKVANSGINITNCYVKNSSIKGGKYATGGLVGLISPNYGRAKIQDCFVDATIEGVMKVGGLVGEDQKAETVVRRNAFYGSISKTGSVNNKVAPIVANTLKESTYDNNYYLKTSDILIPSYPEYGTSISADDIKDASKYVGFDFNNTWMMGEHYAVLKFGNEPAALFSVTSSIDVEVYPNPSQGVCHITLEKAAEISVRNITGQLLLQTNAVAGDNRLNLSSFTNGVYLLTVSDANEHSTVKLQLNR